MDTESSVQLLERIRAGDQSALDTLLRRYVPALRRWSTGRLPRWARDLADTDDLVQDAVVRSVKHLGTFEQRHDGALQAYLRAAVLNRIRDECRRTRRAPGVDPMQDDTPWTGLSPLEAAIGAEAVARYETALATLRPAEREAVIARIEMGYSYAEVAVMLGKPTAEAARQTVARALVRLAEGMRNDG